MLYTVWDISSRGAYFGGKGLSLLIDVIVRWCRIITCWSAFSVCENRQSGEFLSQVQYQLFLRRFQNEASEIVEIRYSEIWNANAVKNNICRTLYTEMEKVQG